jgi:hypothetical protein
LALPLHRARAVPDREPAGGLLGDRSRGDLLEQLHAVLQL